MTAALACACSSTVSTSAPTTPTTITVSSPATSAASPDALEPFTFDVAGGAVRFERPASWRVLDVVPSTMGTYAMLTNGPSHDPCRSDGTGGEACSTPVDAVVEGQVVVVVSAESGPTEGPQPVSEQLERLTGDDATISGRPVRIERDAARNCLPGADHAVMVTAPAEVPNERVHVSFCWRGDADGAIGRAVDAALASITLPPMTTGVAVPSPDHWPVAGSGPGWELRAQAMPTGFECLGLAIDGRPTAQACFRTAAVPGTKQMAVQVGLTRSIDGKRFAFGVILGDDTPAVLDHDPPIVVDALPVDGDVRVFVTQVDTWTTESCDAFALMDALEATRQGERPAVLPPLCRGDEADLYLLTHSAVQEDGRIVTFRRDADRTWRVAFDPWGVQAG